MKKLPFFKFMAAEWLTGNISLESLEVQGLFINLCSVYWFREGNMTIKEVERRYAPYADVLKQVQELEYFKVDQDGKISISFLDEQMGELSKEGERYRRAGTVAAAARWKNADRMRSHANRIQPHDEQNEVQKVQKVQNTPGVKSAKRTTFQNSEICTKEHFNLKFIDWPEEKRSYYFEAAAVWSLDNPENKKADWVRTIRNWDARHPWKPNIIAGSAKFTDNGLITKKGIYKPGGDAN